MQHDTASRRIHHGWAMYDWANSSYSLVIGTAIFPIYYSAVMEAAGRSSFTLLGMPVSTTAAYTFVMAAAYLVVSLGTPYLSALAEVSGSKKAFMRRFIYSGTLACFAMYFFTADAPLLGLLTPFVASIAFAGSLVFYNSYLPEIAAPEEQDALSARGFALGYFGSALMLIVALAFIQNPAWFGHDGPGLITRLTFVSVGLWWLGWGEYSLRRLPEGRAVGDRQKGWIRAAYQQLFDVAKSFRETKGLERFVLGFFFASAGVQTVILIATLFGSQALHLETAALITTVLLIQFVGMLGSWLFARLSRAWGNIRALLVSGVLWMLITFMAYFIQSELQFYLLGAGVGLVLGGIQSLARSTFSQLLPQAEEHVVYFSFYDVAEKLATVLGMVAVGWLETATGDLRLAAVMLSGFFAVAIVLWAGVPWRSKQA
ncbi:MAG: MFS transporter [Schleiferiaceae bacterium]